MDPSTTRVALRYLTASTPSASVLKILQGMAKASGKTGMVNLNLLVETLTALGWKVEETVAATRLASDDQLKVLLAGFVREHRATPWGYTGVKDPKEFWFASEEGAAAALPHLLRAVTKVPASGPASPKVGELYVATVLGPVNDSHDPTRWILRTQFWWYGVSAWRFTTPSGQSTTIGLGVDDRGRLADPTSMKIPAFWTWAYGNGLQQAAQAFLDSMGAAKVEEATRAPDARSLENTGTCPCCFANVKLTGGSIMRHGWMVRGRRGWGQYGNSWHSQACYGFHYQPFEISKEGTTDYLDKAVKPSVVQAKARLRTLQTDPPAEVHVKGLASGVSKPVLKPEGFVFDTHERHYPYNSYGYLLGVLIREVIGDIKEMEDLQRTLEAAILAWAPKPPSWRGLRSRYQGPARRTEDMNPRIENMNPSITRVAARFLSSTDDDIPVFLDYQEALDWIQLKGREYGGVKRFTSSPLYHRAAPLIAELYKTQKSKSDSKIQQEFQNSGMAVGDSVELHQVGMFLTQVHLTGVIVSRAGVPHIQIDPNPFTSRRLIRWNERWQKK